MGSNKKIEHSNKVLKIATSHQNLGKITKMNKRLNVGEEYQLKIPEMKQKTPKKLLAKINTDFFKKMKNV